MTKLTNQPVKDRAEHNAYFPIRLFFEYIYKPCDKF